MKSIPSMPVAPGAPALALALALIIFAALFRLLRVEVLAEWPNFAPLMAIALCGALVLPGWLALAVPLGALVVTDIVLNMHYGFAPVLASDLLRYVCYAAGVGAGILLRNRRAGMPATLATVAGSSLLFYLVTNAAAWLATPAYQKSFAGLIQSLTVGLPGYPPTWMFLRNSLVSDLLFAGLFLAVIHLAMRQQRSTVAHA